MMHFAWFNSRGAGGVPRGVRCCAVWSTTSRAELVGWLQDKGLPESYAPAELCELTGRPAVPVVYLWGAQLKHAAKGTTDRRGMFRSWQRWIARHWPPPAAGTVDAAA